MLGRRRVITGASEERLFRLLQERLQAGADKKEIDERIWDLFGENWCIMFTDLSGFSRQVAQFGIIHFLQTIHESERLLIPAIDDHDGILLKIEGDSFLVIFRSPRRALQCSIEMQKILEKYNQERSAEEQVLLCVGLGYGKVLKIGDHDVFGAEVNAASKLGEDTAGPGEILVTGAVQEATKDMPGVTFKKLDVIPPGASAAYLVKHSIR
ncbi:MAG: adenylate/guanylate cyclase domain-containing protein [Spirochaetales bacterium]|nr:adenylate/guanylate cyclase domain-containing protein [Spirochaetales bacterium]